MVVKYLPAITIIELTLKRLPEGWGKGGQRLSVLPGRHDCLWTVMVLNTEELAVKLAMQIDR